MGAVSEVCVVKDDTISGLGGVANSLSWRMEGPMAESNGESWFGFSGSDVVRVQMHLPNTF